MLYNWLKIQWISHLLKSPSSNTHIVPWMAVYPATQNISFFQIYQTEPKTKPINFSDPKILYGEPSLSINLSYLPTQCWLAHHSLHVTRVCATHCRSCGRVSSLFTDKNGRESAATHFITSCTYSSSHCQIKQEKKDRTREGYKKKISWIAEEVKQESTLEWFPTMLTTDQVKGLKWTPWYLCLYCVSSLSIMSSTSKH